jgi:DNA mismatch repair protein MutS2
MEAGRAWGRGIEWDAVRRLLAREARTAMGREQAAGAEPSTDLEAIRGALDETGQARDALGASGAPPFEPVPDVRPVLERCGIPGSVLDGAELVLLVPFLDAGPRLVGWGRGLAGRAARITAMTEALPRPADLRETLRRAVADDGTLADDASPALRRIRRELRERRRRTVADLERLLNTHESLLADRYVTIRHGRYVLPVRAEARSRFRGIVHDRSQSGQTVFMEPAEMVEANNDLVQLAREEEHEIARVLAELTDLVRARLPDLEALARGLGALDWIFARAHLAERWDGVAPAMTRERRVHLREARHPLLLAQRWGAAPAADPDPVVPADIELTPERPLLVITGPNAGGKTIALKTLALHVLLAQTGCHVPARAGSGLPVVSQLHAIIGDDQSVAENLSTFSAFVKQVREILDEADAGALVLLDELGAGTDPDEGAALAQAILEDLAERGTLVMATTHLEPLKAFASTHPRARNASVEFDTATLAPTFRLRYDRPGQSYALTIAARLGLRADLIARAQAHRSEHGARAAELLARLDEHTRTEARRTRALEAREQEAAARLASAREAESTALARARETVSGARQEAARLVADVRRVVSTEWERLKRADRTRRDLEETRRALNGVAARVADPSPALPPEEPARLVPGARVSAEHLGLHGSILSTSGDTATIQAGAVTVRVPLAALRLASPSTSGAHARSSSISVPEKRGVHPELHLLGRRVDEARDMVEQFLDSAFMAGLASVRLVHGKGTGALRKTVRDVLSTHPLVDSFRDGEPGEGGAGATVAALKVG